MSSGVAGDRGTAKTPRVVVVSRATDYERLLARHGTRQQAEFFLKTRGQSLAAADARHERQRAALEAVSHAIPVSWRRSRIDRRDLASFVFEPGDLVAVVGQGGLVANVAKYLEGQRVLGFNPDPSSYDGVLVRLCPADARALLDLALAPSAPIDARTMVRVELDDGQGLLALNEVFLGHATHQSARYRLRCHGSEERQSSSGAIVTTGTGATGWARSITRERRDSVPLPAPGAHGLAFFVREAFPSVSTGTSLTQGVLGEGDVLELTSEMNEGGVVFGDGIEEDRLELGWGVRARVSIASTRLALVAPSSRSG